MFTRARRQETILLAAIVVLAFVLRLAWIAYADFEPTLSDDAGRYDLLGRSLAEGGGYINPNGNITMFWPPGYPFVLAAVYKVWPTAALGDHEVTAALVLNAALGAATVALTYAVARPALGRRVALGSAALLALFPSMIFFANATLTETLFTFLLMLSIWLLVEAERRRSRRLFVAGALIAGYATLVRGLALLLAVVMAPFWLRRGAGGRGTVIKVAVASALIVAVVAPWTARNYGESGSLVLISSNAGVDFYIGHSEGADGRGRIVDELVFRYPELPPAEAEARISRDGFREGIEWALRHPLDEGELALRKAFFLWYRDDEGLRWNDGHGERSIMPDGARDAMIWVSNVYYWSVILFAAFGVVLTVRNLVRADADRSEDLPLRSTPSLSRRDQHVAVLLLSLLAYWTLVHVAFFGDPRFHAPVIPVVCVFAAMGLDSVLHRLSAVENVHDPLLRSG